MATLQTLLFKKHTQEEAGLVTAEALVLSRTRATMTGLVTLVALTILVHVRGQVALVGPHTVSAGVLLLVGVTAEAGGGSVSRAGQTRPVTVWLENQHTSELLFIPFAPVNVNLWRCTFPTSAFVGGLVMVSVAAALGQALSVVTDGSRVATHVAVVRARAVARGAIRVAAHALLLLLAGKVPVRTVVHALTSLEEVELVAVWVRERVVNVH